MKNYESTRLFKSKCADYHFQKDYIANLKKQQPHLFDDNLLLKTIDSNNIKTKLLVESKIAKMKEEAVQEYIDDVEDTFDKIKEDYGEVKYNICWDYLVENMSYRELEEKYMYSLATIQSHIVNDLYDNNVVLHTIDNNKIWHKGCDTDEDVAAKIIYFKRNARKYKDACIRAHELNQQIERLTYIMTGESGIRYDREQTDGGAPVNISEKYLKLIEKIDKIKVKIEKEKEVINYVDSVVQNCSPLVKLYIIEGYLNNNGAFYYDNTSNKISRDILMRIIKKEIAKHAKTQ